MADSLRVGRALSVLERVACEMCVGKVVMTANLSSTTASVRFGVTSSADSESLVGKKGAHIYKLTTLAILLFRGTDLRVDIEGVDCASQGGNGTAFEPKSEWPRDSIEALVKEAAEVACGEADVSTRPIQGRTDKSMVQVFFRHVGKAEVKFGWAMAILCKPMGVKHGHKLNVAVYER